MRCPAIVLRSFLAGLIGLLAAFAGAASADPGEDAFPESEEWQRRLELLRSVPYLSASETVVDEAKVGVTRNDPRRSHQGYNFYCTLSSGEAFLMNMDGEVVHRWVYPHHRRERGTDHGIFLSNGDAVLLKEYRQLVRLDWNSRLLWKRSLPVHHDVVQAADGTFYAVLRTVESYRGYRVTFPSIAHLGPDGELIGRWSAFDHLDELRKVLDTRSFLDTILDHISGNRRSPRQGPRGRARASEPRSRMYDYFHMNGLAVLDGSASADGDSLWGHGNILVCLRNVNQIAVLEKNTYRVLWAWGEGELQWPHHPTLLDDGNILIFDNGVHRGYSRVIELDPVDERIVWEYISDPPEDFYSHTRGAAQRLPNGNTLITESDRGRAFEVTPSGEIVWMWQNPDLVEPLWRSLDSARAGGEAVRRSKALYRMKRLPPERVEPLLDRWWWGGREKREERR
jgi:hypothetical protein